ncbi:Atrial natriuretic peptide clearance receptor [Plakobranchus ocellatus]|uniref:Atrial natriuretic peptide clearance receptor n=1 Tax=Plakobranchus ocellatus TaxID=259542 RepID=A0AAV4D679_9GAST|nr:Atrial natriuretic peptide clearance receptor [Plakobranchus ocellatus]
MNHDPTLLSQDVHNDDDNDHDEYDDDINGDGNYDDNDVMLNVAMVMMTFLVILIMEMTMMAMIIRVKWYDTQCTAKAALAAAVDARRDFDPDLILGPPCSAGKVLVSRVCHVISRTDCT